MPGFLLHMGATAFCPHGGMIMTIKPSPRVFVSAQPVAALGDTFLVTGCAFAPVKPQPCITVQWLTPATRVFVNGQPAILQASAGLCQSAEKVPQGPPVIVMTQTRVTGM
jgi:hypothetical protein